MKCKHLPYTTFDFTLTYSVALLNYIFVIKIKWQRKCFSEYRSWVNFKLKLSTNGLEHTGRQTRTPLTNCFRMYCKVMVFQLFKFRYWIWSKLNVKLKIFTPAIYKLQQLYDLSNMEKIQSFHLLIHTRRQAEWQKVVPLVAECCSYCEKPLRRGVECSQPEYIDLLWLPIAMAMAVFSEFDPVKVERCGALKSQDNSNECIHACACGCERCLCSMLYTPVRAHTLLLYIHAGASGRVALPCQSTRYIIHGYNANTRSATWSWTAFAALPSLKYKDRQPVKVIEQSLSVRVPVGILCYISYTNKRRHAPLKSDGSVDEFVVHDPVGSFLLDSVRLRPVVPVQVVQTHHKCA